MAEDVTKVCVVLPTSNHLHRQILEGVVNYAASHGPWQMFLITEDNGINSLHRARIWGANAAIAVGSHGKWTREVLSWKVPSVIFNSTSSRPPKHAVFLKRDQERVGKTAAEYFLDRHYSSFAFIGAATGGDWSDRRRQGFCKRLARAGYEAQCAEFTAGQEAMRKFLTSLPRETAIFAAHDRSAQMILGLCLDLGLAVPEHFAVLGVDDDRIICEAMTPSLSSISLDGVNSGEYAARLLSRLLSRRKVHSVLKLDLPRVITRQSTDTNAIADPVLSRTLARIMEDYSNHIRISDIAEELGYSTRTLEMKARHAFGCTLKDKIIRMRLNEAVRLLSNSKLPIQDVATHCGFCSASYLGVKLKEAFGYSPSVFRP